MNRKTYRKIAKKHGVDIQEIKKDMRAAIKHTYLNPTQEALKIPRKKEIPTIDEFVSYVVSQVKK